MSKRQSAYLSLTIFFFLVVAVFFSIGNYFETKKHSIYSEALELTSSGQYIEALDKAKQSGSEDAVLLAKELTPLINNPKDVVDALVLNMNSEELEATKSKSNLKQYFFNKDINQYYLNEISKINDLPEYQKSLKSKIFKQEKNNRKDEFLTEV